MPETISITVAATDEAAGKLVPVIRLIRELGGLRPGGGWFRLREAKTMAELVLEDDMPVVFAIPAGARDVVARAVAPLLCLVDGAGVAAEDVLCSNGWLARVETFANTGSDPGENEDC